MKVFEISFTLPIITCHGAQLTCFYAADN